MDDEEQLSGSLCMQFLDETLIPYQSEIVADILFNRNRLITCTAATRAGKSWAVARACVLKAFLKENESIGVIAPTYHKTKIIMSHIADCIAKSPLIASETDLSVKLGDIERLKKEVSKQKITFKNGSYIEVLTADVKGEGMALMGRGYKTIIVDESAEIPDGVYSKIFRMLSEHPDSMLFEIGNPWYINDHFYEHSNDPNWKFIKISWQDCLREGRLTEQNIAEVKREITKLEFRVLYEAEFPTESINAVFKDDWLHKAEATDSNFIYKKVGIGVDVARGGRDLTVITVLGYDEESNRILYIENEEIDSNDTMQIVGKTLKYSDKYKNAVIAIDTIGVGAGVYDRLKEQIKNVKPFVAGQESRSDRFFNLKTENVMSLAKFFEEGRILNYPYKSKYTNQFKQWEVIPMSDRKLRIVDPEEKSPDWSDSFTIAFYATQKPNDIVVLKNRLFL